MHCLETHTPSCFLVYWEELEVRDRLVKHPYALSYQMPYRRNRIGHQS